MNRDGTMTAVVGALTLPTSLEFVRNTAYIVTLGGDVLRFDNVCGSTHERYRRSGTPLWKRTPTVWCRPGGR
ncbi:MAG: hypothetical protein JWM50_1857 [Microbacteriaceae bacterium]|nr:hypothetical protein [Microbacteriaceae bacterium]